MQRMENNNKATTENTKKKTKPFLYYRTLFTSRINSIYYYKSYVI